MIMAEQCSAHERCMTKHEAGLSEIKGILDEVKDLLRDGSIKFAAHELRIAALEANIQSLRGGWNLKGAVVRLAFDLIKWAILAGGAAIIWALQNGYGGK